MRIIALSRSIAPWFLLCIATQACASADTSPAESDVAEAAAAPDGAPAPDPGASAEALSASPEPIPICQDVVWYEEKLGTCPPGGGPGVTICTSKCVIDKEIQIDGTTGGVSCKTVAAYCMNWVCPCPKDAPGLF